MIRSIEEAKELCKKYEINIKDHKTVIVTANNNIYLSDNIDPADLGQVFYLKGEKVSVEEVPLEKELPKIELSQDDIDLEKEIEKEEAEKKATKKK